MNRTKKQEELGVSYHIRPPYGLLNDPNGLVQFKGSYHVFYQWNPHGTIHETKSWGHVVSNDLVRWRTLPPALEPSEWYDKDGCYSGSAVIHGEELLLFYTGTVKQKEGDKKSYQCMASSIDGIHFTKKGPLFEHPPGYTRHVRDPKVWQDEDGLWWMVVGAQTEDMIGAVLVYSSKDLETWEARGPLMKEPLALGYMWECPDILLFPDKDILLFSPQGLEPEGDFYHNIFQSGYLSGHLDKDGLFEVGGSPFRELDRGFEFYAPQTFIDDKKRRLMFAWMGAMDPLVEQAVPTVRQSGWVHHLSLPRELILEGDRLIQKPVEELKQLRGNLSPAGATLEKMNLAELPSTESEIIVKWPEGCTEDFKLSLREEVVLFYETSRKRLTIERTAWYTGKRETRSVMLKETLSSLQFFLEATTMEVFVNEGKETFSLRYFTQKPSMKIKMEEQLFATPSVTIYPLNIPN